MHSKINTLIAEKFLKLDVVVNKRGLATLGEPDYFDIAGDLQLQNPVPNYSGDIACAWPLLAELYKRGFFWRLDSKGDKVIITLQNLKRKTFMIEAESGAEAICEGALKVADEEDTGKLIELHIKNSTEPPDGNAS